MARLQTRWGFGLSVAATAAAVLAIVIFWVSPGGQANAAEVLHRGVQAVSGIISIHMECKMKTGPNDNFSAISPNENFSTIEIWKQFEGKKEWRIEKPGRFALMDGQSTIQYFKEANTGVKYGPSKDAFDTGWLHEMTNIAQMLTSELNAIQTQGSEYHVQQTQGADGALKSAVVIESKTGLPEGDYLKNKFLKDADTRREYIFDSKTNRLEDVKIFLITQSGDNLIFEVSKIDYNPYFDSAVFHPDVLQHAVWEPEERPALPENEKYAAMTVGQAARAFFEACGSRNWNEVSKYWPLPLDEPFQQLIGGVQIISLGESFTSAAYPGAFVPYEIKLSSGEIKKHNLAMKRDGKTGRWMFDGGV
jgi:outer membrane lipoprotein-sorting protein